MANYILLERIELNASAASVTFANIPQTGYTDLKLVASIRDNPALIGDYQNITINGSTTGFSSRFINGDGTAAASSSAYPRIAGEYSSGSSTANTFGSVELYFPNYTSSSNKSYSVDSVSENNGTTAYADLTAGLWSNTAAITSITLTPNSGSYVQYSTFSLYGIAALGTTPAIAPKASGGNIIDFDGTYWIHTFLTSGTFTPQIGLTCDYLVSAGGGGGGGVNGYQEGGGGGGAGGLRSTLAPTGGGGSAEAALSLSATSYTVTIGAGGTAGSSSGTRGGNGSDSVFSTITAIGGGGGGASGPTSNTAGIAGGAGGGGGGLGTAGSGTANQGYAGGAGTGVQHGAGGGGAAAVGSAGGTSSGAGGSAASNAISGSAISYAGGGGGGGTYTGGANPTGGTGGANAGNGGSGNGGVGTSAVANRGGGGGGGGGGNGQTVAGGAGGSGIVIIRYLA